MKSAGLNGLRMLVRSLSKMLIDICQAYRVTNSLSRSISEPSITPYRCPTSDNSIYKRFLWAITMGQLRDSYGEENWDFRSLSIYPHPRPHIEKHTLFLWGLLSLSLRHEWPLTLAIGSSRSNEPDMTGTDELRGHCTEVNYIGHNSDGDSRGGGAHLKVVYRLS